MLKRGWALIGTRKIHHNEPETQQERTVMRVLSFLSAGEILYRLYVRGVLVLVSSSWDSSPPNDPRIVALHEEAANEVDPRRARVLLLRARLLRRYHAHFLRRVHEAVSALPSGSSARDELVQQLWSPEPWTRRRTLYVEEILRGHKLQAVPCDAELLREVGCKAPTGKGVDNPEWWHNVVPEDDAPRSELLNAVRIAEIVTCWLSQMSRARDGTDVFLACSQAMRAFTGTGLLESVAIIMDRIQEKVDDLLAVLTTREWRVPQSTVYHTAPAGERSDVVESSCAELQSDEPNPFRRLRFTVEHADSMRNHPIVKKLEDLAYFMLAHGIGASMGFTFDNLQFTKAQAEATRNSHSSKLAFAQHLIATTIAICERLWDCHTTGTWSPLLHNGEAYGSWCDQVYLLKEQAQMLHNPEAAGFSYHDFLGRLESTIEQGDAIQRYASCDKGTMSLIKRLMSDLRLIKGTECTRKAARKQRQTPFSVLYYGGSSVGKSSLMQVSYVHFAKVHNLPSDPEYQYTRCFADEYWSGFQSSMWAIVLDDVAAKRPEMNDDPSMNEILQVVNQTPYCPPQADLADKGKTPLQPLLVQASTNTKSLCAFDYYNNELAIRRRFPYVVTVHVKDEYATNSGCEPALRMLDASKCVGHVGYPDFWELTVEKITATLSGGRQRAALTHVATFTDIHEFLAFMGKASKTHFEQQTGVAKSLEAMRQIEICGECYMPVAKCKCKKETVVVDEAACVQSVAEDVISGTLWSLAFMYCLFLHYVVYQTVKQNLRASLEAAKNGFVSALVTGASDAVATTVKAKCPGWLANKLLAPVPAQASSPEPDEPTHTLSASGELTPIGLRAEAKYSRAMIVAAGQKTRRARIPAWLWALSLLVPALAAYRMWRSLPSEQTKSDEIGSPPAVYDAKVNFWAKDEFKPADFVNRLTTSWKGLKRDGKDGWIDKVAANVAYISLEFVSAVGRRRRTSARALGLGGHVFVTNSHVFEEGAEYFDLDVKMGPSVAHVSANFTYRVYASSLHRVPERDIVFFTMSSAAMRPDLRGLLPKEAYRTQSPGLYVTRDVAGEVGTLPVAGISAVNYKLMGSDEVIPSWRAFVNKATVNGFCGTPLVAETPQGPVLLGLHRTGAPDGSVTSVRLTTELVDEAYKSLRARVVQNVAPTLETVEGNPDEIQALHHKSVFRYLEGGTAEVFGSFSGFRPAHKSRVTDTYIRDSVVKRGYQQETGAPVMKGWQPWRHAAMDITQQDFVADESVIRKCVEAFAAEIIAGLTKEDLAELQPLDNDTTLNGFPGTQFIDKMNRQTSMGYPWRKRKDAMLIKNGAVGVWQDHVAFPPEFYDRVDKIIERYQAGERASPIFCGHLKDEPTKKSKIDSGKTRVFCAGPADWSFVVRKFLLPYVRITQKNHTLFECAPGTNVYSPEWDEFYHYLTQFGVDRIIAGDYGKFDKKMAAVWIQAAFEIIRLVHEAAGWPEEWLKIIDGIAVDTAFPYVDFNGDLVMFWGSNPSGHPLTVIINSLVNSLYVRYCWVMVGNDLSKFKLLVALLTYGDDNIMGVAQAVKNFDHTVLVEKLREIGVEYTMADKEAESVPFVNIAEVSFLKRRWRWDEELGHHMAQLEESSICKMLTTCLPSDRMSPEAHAVEIMVTALNEYFMYGRAVYDTKRAMFEGIVDEMNLRPYVAASTLCDGDVFPTYEERRTLYMSNREGFDGYPGGRCAKCCA